METKENKFPIFTNNLKVVINRNKVNERFTIFQVGTKNLFFHENVLDLPSDKYKAQSVAYYQKTRWFAMFKKGKVDFADFKIEIPKIDDSAIINQVDLFDTDEDSKSNIKDVELAQLLVNSLKNRENDLFSYNNLTGSLYYFCDFEKMKDAKSFEFLKLRFYSSAKDSIALEANFETFSESAALKKYGKKAEQKYVFDEATGEFRRRLKNDYGTHCRFFDKGAISRKGKRGKFLDFSNNDNFLKSKSGMIATFFEDIKENLGELISIEQIPLFDYKSYDNPRENYENKDYEHALQKRTICIVDTVNSEESKKMKTQITDFLKTEYDVAEVFDKRQKDAYVIEIIHDKDSDFYATKSELNEPSRFADMNKPKDQHNLYTEEEIIQHITVENSAEKIDGNEWKHLMHNVVQELIIKNDLHEKQISLVNWGEPVQWTFVKCGTGQGKKTYNFIYYKMTISTLGKITFETFNSSDFPETEEWTVIDKIFRFYNKDNKNLYSKIECIVYQDISEINVIYKTKQFTLPNIGDFSKRTEQSDPKKLVETRLVKESIAEYLKNKEIGETEKTTLEKIYKNLENINSRQISLKEIRELKNDDGTMSNIKPKSIKGFIQYFYEKTSETGTPILIHPQLKSGENEVENFNSFMGLKTALLDGKFKYFVGKKKGAIQLNLPTSCIIRDVIPWNQDGENPIGKILFDKIAHMLTVEFVRNGQYTVTPFPVKYLNEYIRFKEKDEN